MAMAVRLMVVSFQIENFPGNRYISVEIEDGY